MDNELKTRSKPTESLQPTAQVASDQNSLFYASVTLAKYAFLLQFGLRLITFSLNGLTYRFLDPGIMGIVNFRLGLFYSTLVFTAREAFRKACLSKGGELLVVFNRKPNNNSDQASITFQKRSWQSLLNVCWLILPLGCLLISVLVPIWICVWPWPAFDKGFAPIVEPLILENQYKFSVLIYSLSALLELSTEPFWLVFQLGQFIRSRILLEALANIARAFGIIFAVCCLSSKHGLYLLVLPQILHGVTLLFGYFGVLTYIIRCRYSVFISNTLCFDSISNIFPTLRNSTFDWSCFKLTWVFFRQGLLKQFLTEGERYLISAFHLLSFANQGIYDTVNNLGALVPRMCFAPIEESCHLLFSQCINRDLPASNQNEKLVLLAFRLLKSSLRLTSLLAWIGFVFSQAFSHLLLHLYGGPTLASQDTAVNLLRLFSFYLIFLAWNGPTEAFLNAAMSQTEVNSHNRRLAIFSIVFLLASWLLVPSFGAVGFVFANCINIFTRAVYNILFIKGYVDNLLENPEAFLRSEKSDTNQLPRNAIKQFQGLAFLSIIFPSKTQTLVFVFAATSTLLSEAVVASRYTLMNMIGHICVGILVLILVLVSIYHQDKHILVLLIKSKNAEK